MKKIYLSLVVMLLSSLSAFATGYKIDETKAITADANSLDGVTAVVTDPAGEKTWVAFSGSNGQDINANCTTVLAWSSMSPYSYIKFYAAEGQADDVYYIKFVNADGEIYVPTGDWHDKSGCLNVTGNGGGLFVGGLNNQNGQDAANAALWKVTKTEAGYTLYNIGKERYAIPGVGVQAGDWNNALKLYSEFVEYDPEAEGDYSARMSNAKADWAGATGVYGGGAERYNGDGCPEGDLLVQTIENLPAGKYEVKFAAIANIARDLDPATYAGEGIAMAFANGAYVDVTVGTKAALDAFDWVNGQVNIDCEVGEDGILKYGMLNIKEGGQWYVVKALGLFKYPEPKYITASDGKKYKLLSENLVTNGSFDDGLNGWLVASYAQDAATAGTNMSVVAEGGYDGGAYAQAAPEGKGATNSLMGKWNVEAGKLYYIAAYTGGAAPAANNFQYNKIWNINEAGEEASAIVQLNWPATVGEWALTDAAFTATTPAVAIRLAWNSNARLDGVQLYEVEEAGIDLDAYKAAAIAALPVASLFTISEEDLAAIVDAINAATTTDEVDAAAATVAEKNIPALSGEWTVKNATAQMYINGAVISETPAIITFEKAEGGFYMKSDDTYINMKGGNTWSMSADAEAKTAWTYTLADGVYTIKGPNGNIGVDYGIKAPENTDVNLYGNKSGNGTTWVIEAYVAPDPYASTLAVAAGEANSYLNDKIKIGENEYNAYKIGTAKATGSINVTIPAGSYGMSFYALSWNTTTTDVTATAGEKTQTYSATGAGISGNSPYTYDAEKGGEPETHLYKFGYSEPLAEDVVVNLTAPARVVFFGINALTEAVQEEAAGWDGETVVTSLDEATVTKLSDLDGMTITLPGAKSIEMIDPEEIAYLALQNQDGSEAYGIWSPTYGGTCSIDGETITLSGFVTIEDYTIDIPATATTLYIEDYGTFIVDGVQDVRYIPTIELTANIAGAAEPFAIVVSNNEVVGTAEGVEASENGVMYQFNVTAQGKALSKGEGVPTLSLMEDATVDFGASQLVAYEAETAYVRFMTLQVPYFTMPGTYVLNIPEGTFVDAEGTPNAEVTLKWVIVQGDDEQENKDITAKYIVNADLSNGLSGWTAVTFSTPAKQANSGYATEAYAGWGALDATEYSLTQKITLPAGSYKLTNNSFFRQAGGAKDNVEKSLAYLVAGEEQVLIKTLGSIDAKAYANSQIEGAGVLSSGKAMYFNEIDFTLAEETEIEIGIKGTFDEMKSWMVTAGFHLYDMNFTAASKEDVSDLIANNSFENGTEGWTVEGQWSEQSNGEAVKVGTRYVEKWQASGQLPDASIMQTLTDLKNGKYILSAVVHSLGEGAFLVANNDRTEVTTAASLQTVETEVTDGTLTIGFVRDNYQSSWIAVDNFTLVYCAPGKAEINIETVEVGETEPNEYGDQFYTVTLTVPAEDIAGLGVAHAYCEGIQLTDGETTCTFVATAVDGIDVTEGENVVFTCKDAMPSYTSDAEYEGDFRQTGTYQGTCTIVLTDADYNEIGAAVFEGEVILPTTTGINEVKFNVTSVVYTISGVRVQKPVKGINIINGKKVVIK